MQFRKWLQYKLEYLFICRCFCNSSLAGPKMVMKMSFIRSETVHSYNVIIINIFISGVGGVSLGMYL